MKIMPVIPTVNNNNNRPQRQQAFGAIFARGSGEVLTKLLGHLPENAKSSFLNKINPETGDFVQMVSKSGQHPIVHLTHNSNRIPNYTIKVMHPNFINKVTNRGDYTNDPNTVSNILGWVEEHVNAFIKIMNEEAPIPVETNPTISGYVNPAISKILDGYAKII